MYHVALRLDPEQKKQLKSKAASEGESVRDFITKLVLHRLSADGQKSKRK